MPPVGVARRQVGTEIVLTIAGNKSDLERQRVVSRAEAAEYAQSTGAHYCETSAKTGRGINELFSSMARRLVDSRKLAAPPGGGGASVQVVDDEPARSGGGC